VAATVAVVVAATAAVAVGVVDGAPRLMAGPEPDVELTTTASGVRVVSERMPEARSVSIGVWVGVGSRDEPGELAGASHFLEHLLFKGTDTRAARELAMAVEARGGEMNAYTSRESTVFYLRLPSKHLEFGLDLLADVVTAPALRPDEVDAEREVILEELAMAVDTPDDLVAIRLYEHLFAGHPLGRETLGDEDTLASLTPDEIRAFHQQWYRPANLVVGVAGACSHADVNAMLDRSALSANGKIDGDRPRRAAPDHLGAPLVVEPRPIEQVHVALGWAGLPQHDPDRYALAVANQILGGGMSSRLFQEIREQRGLAYTVYSSHSMFSDCGVQSIYAGTSPQRLDEVLTVIDEVIDEVLAHGISIEEYDVALGYIEGATLLGLEDSGSRMSRIGSSLLARDEVVPVDEQLTRLRAVTLDDIDAVLHRVLCAPRVLSAVGACAPRDSALTSSVERANARIATVAAT
jgi:predicted Zn-dependent peptidase